MTGRFSPGQRARLAALGINARRYGSPGNTAPVVAIPKNGDELASMLSDRATLGTLLKPTANGGVDSSGLQAMVEGYAAQAQGPGTDLNKAVERETQRQLAALLRDQGADGTDGDVLAAASTLSTRLDLSPQASKVQSFIVDGKQGTAYNPQASGAKLDSKVKNSQEFFQMIDRMRDGDPDALKWRSELKNNYSSTVPADGGFLIPEIMRSGLLELALQQAIVRSRAFVVPMDSLRVILPSLDVTSNVSNVFGGMIGYWTAEGSPFTPSQAKFRRTMLEAKKLTGFSLVPAELLQDSPMAFAAFVARQWPKALAWFEDSGFRSGNGVGMPLGYAGAPAAVSVTRHVPGHIVTEDILEMYSRTLPASVANGIWEVCPEAIPELGTLSISVGTGGSSVMMMNMANGMPLSILGRPVIVNEKSPRLGSRGDISFNDLSYYVVGDRQTMMAASSTDYAFNTEETAFRISQRVDGRPWIETAITPANGGPALSPFVDLAA